LRRRIAGKSINTGTKLAEMTAAGGKLPRNGSLVVQFLGTPDTNEYLGPVRLGFSKVSCFSMSNTGS
jgi:23S rRNA U2552 (ribose-2'-O)-methylase RlmE/FtsJ